MSTLDNWNIKVNGMFTFFGILSPCFVLLKVILRFGKTVLLTLYSGWQIGRSTWGSGFSLLELFWQLILKTITVARNFQLQFLFLNLIAVSYENSQTEFWKGGTKGFTSDTWLRPKLICDAWILQKSDRDPWIYDPVWDVICLLKYRLPVNFFFQLVKSSRFSRNVLHKARDLKFCLSYTWRVNFSKNSGMKSCQDHESHSESSHPGTHSALNFIVFWLGIKANQ